MGAPGRQRPGATRSDAPSGKRFLRFNHQRAAGGEASDENLDDVHLAKGVGDRSYELRSMVAGRPGATPMASLPRIVVCSVQRQT